MAATETNVIVSKENCPKPSDTCPVCLSFSGLDLIDNICKMSNIYTVKVQNEPANVMNSTSLCGKASLDKVHLGKPKVSNDFFYSMRPECVCEPLTDLPSGLGSKVIILENKANLVSSKSGYPLSNKVHIMSHNEINEFDIHSLLKKCEEK